MAREEQPTQHPGPTRIGLEFRIVDGPGERRIRYCRDCRRCSHAVDRAMRALGLSGITRAKGIRTTILARTATVEDRGEPVNKDGNW